MLSFTFGGKNSYSDYGILIAKRPIIPSPKRRVTNVVVPGRSSSLKFDEGTYEDITMAVECSLKDDSLPNAIDEIKGWLYSAGEGSLIFDFQPDRKYIAQVVNSIDFTQAYKYFSKFIIVFNCQPFKYSVSNNPVTLLSPGSIVNTGSIYSEPVFNVTGGGNITLTINSKTVTLTAVTTNIILDSVQQNAYNGAGDNLNSKVTGEFPILEVGSNSISWTGSITSVVITPNWRWL
ncbi:MAG: distal tail protein Dit [Clostridiaceae bacterium]